MSNDEKILEALQQMNGRLDQMNGRLDQMNGRLDKIESDISGMKTEISGMKVDIADIKETLEEHTTALDTLNEWTDRAAIEIRIPFAEARKDN